MTAPRRGISTLQRHGRWRTAQRLLVQRAVETSLRDASALGLRSLLIDDLHFADDASVDLLQSLVEADGVVVLSAGGLV